MKFICHKTEQYLGYTKGIRVDHQTHFGCKFEQTQTRKRSYKTLSKMIMGRADGVKYDVVG